VWHGKNVTELSKEVVMLASTVLPYTGSVHWSHYTDEQTQH